jgi:hypothetical protein
MATVIRAAMAIRLALPLVLIEPSLHDTLASAGRSTVVGGGCWWEYRRGTARLKSNRFDKK